MKEKTKNELKNDKGITLIVLVITIIVLLILASVSIAMLTEENGILAQAKKAKEETDKASVIEEIRTDILEIQVGGNTTLTQEQLKGILEKYFKDVPDDVTIDNTLTTKDEYGDYDIPVLDVYNGKIIKENMVYFTVNGENYETEKNTTWEEFLDSQECQGLNSNESVYGNIGKNIVFMGGATGEYGDFLALNNKGVKKSDIIQEGSYTIIVNGHVDVSGELNY